MRDTESKKRNEKKKKTRICDKSRLCRDHPRRARRTKVVIWGGVLDIVNSAKFHQNRFRNFWSTKSRISSFCYAWLYGLCKG